MNVENLFVKSSDHSLVVELAIRALANPITEPAWELPSSYSPLLATNPKRKLAISPNKNGWIAIIESKEVVDFSMAKYLADELKTTAAIIQISDAAGELGFLLYENGKAIEQAFEESVRDPLNHAREILKRFGVPFDMMMFREVVHLSALGWSIKQRC